MRRVSPARQVIATLLVLAGLAGLAGAQQGPEVPDTAAQMAALARTAFAELQPGEPAVLEWHNREIATLRMLILGRDPAQRVQHVRRELDQLLELGRTGPVTLQPFEGGVLVLVDGALALSLADGDLQVLTAEEREAAGARAAQALERALAEAVEARTPQLLLRSALRAGLATLLFALLLRGLLALDVALRARLRRRREREAALVAGAPEDMAHLGLRRVVDLALRATRGLLLLLGVTAGWTWLSWVLLQFPYLRPLGEALDGQLRALLLGAFDALLAAIPDLAIAAAILLLARQVVASSDRLFAAVQRGRVRVPFVDPEVAQPTRRLAAFAIWVFALVLAFPYLPLSDTEAFRGMTVFLGLLVSLGATGVVGQALAGLMLMYSRALRPGDYVRVGEAEGTVTEVNLLTTRLRSAFSEELVLPNATVLAQTTLNYSSWRGEGGVQVRTAVSIGYDTPWRQVHALLLRAAQATPGVRRDPPPRVVQVGLDDWYVRYELAVALDDPAQRIPLLSELNQRIQDEFNAHGVQIMSPQYLARAEAPVLVPPANWHAPPAAPEGARPGAV